MFSKLNIHLRSEIQKNICGGYQIIRKFEIEESEPLQGREMEYELDSLYGNFVEPTLQRFEQDYLYNVLIEDLCNDIFFIPYKPIREFQRDEFLKQANRRWQENRETFAIRFPAKPKIVISIIKP